jgi:NAD(P)-dependent dehydrogenase (short-subunit alcohol dehydrogenase family)
MPTVVVTGTDQGLGRAFVDEFVAQGFFVFAGSHSLAAQGEGPRNISATLAELPLDVTDPRLVRTFAEAVGARVESLDLLVNNAAVNPEKGVPLEALDISVTKTVLDVNALGPLRMTQALLGLLERGEKKTIVNVSSEAGSLTTCGRSSWFGYCMSKAALNIQSRLLDNYLGPRGFRVLSLHPGWLKTPMANFEGPVAPEEAAARIARLVLDPTLETPKSSGFLQYDGATHPW